MIDAPVSAPDPDTKAAASVRPATGAVVAGRYEVSRAAELCALLQERPPVFPIAPGDPVRPLALGTLQALTRLARPGVPPEQLKQALKVYCLGLGYLRVLSRPSAWRYDLAGHPVEPVSEEHRTGAWRQFKGVRAYRDRIRLARRAAEQPQEMPAAVSVDTAPAAVSYQPA
ncbi:ProQ/FINO family protein [Methylobacterium radiotolerans]|uniref:ProQ/FINO family protein n=1 Tax=Methylobacterium radiotolerans TaxID=31998 RepID=UPI001F23286C|nr:ProQ/FINO family protein [Methylobacterium radiotolerans]UIY45655.1 ProQ/FinO family protein [Methylobacterium radiotolerans]